jgi:hypothetical protein
MHPFLPASRPVSLSIHLCIYLSVCLSTHKPIQPPSPHATYPVPRYTLCRSVLPCSSPPRATVVSAPNLRQPVITQFTLLTLRNWRMFVQEAHGIKASRIRRKFLSPSVCSLPLPLISPHTRPFRVYLSSNQRHTIRTVLYCTLLRQLTVGPRLVSSLRDQGCALPTGSVTNRLTRTVIALHTHFNRHFPHNFAGCFVTSWLRWRIWITNALIGGHVVRVWYNKYV